MDQSGFASMRRIAFGSLRGSIQYRRHLENRHVAASGLARDTIASSRICQDARVFVHYKATGVMLA